MNWMGIFLRGLLMGVCDTIPGVSGGTIAFITGIYERLISAVNGCVKAVPQIIKSKLDILSFKKNSFTDYIELLKKLDVFFLITLLLGIATAILTTSKLVGFLLGNHFALTISFFIGLILASSITIFSHIKTKSYANLFFVELGLLAGVILTFISPKTIDPNLLYVFFGGFLAISAMFLPGISGAFILLIMGLYQYMIDALHNIRDNILIVITFIFGAGIGAITISKLINYLFSVSKDKTLSFLFGLVFGTLAIPVRRVFQETIFSIPTVIGMIILFAFGMVIVIFSNRLMKK